MDKPKNSEEEFTKYVKECLEPLRPKIDYAFIFKCESNEEREKFFNEFFGKKIKPSDLAPYIHKKIDLSHFDDTYLDGSSV